ncbi:hypothetical protein GOP47_0002589 [Adiantum capillus-veneris]|uniref:Uncharacterized protein n=1 Tax=Adiantum capillus-veneris TaxID=13818 RepID=A0A9D4VAD4_ADICA|nr:hypothetical protein GOP47_0002589 [Adiantum capillus-veneris]
MDAIQYWRRCITTPRALCSLLLVPFHCCVLFLLWILGLAASCSLSLLVLDLQKLDLHQVALAESPLIEGKEARKLSRGLQFEDPRSYSFLT